MSTTYKIIAGDTLAAVARKKYGTDAEAARVASANPGVSEPLAPGAVLVIPALPGAPTDSASVIPSSDPDEVAVVIGGQRFRYWDGLRITRSIDTVDTAEFSAPFDYRNAELREVFRPFSYKSMTINVGGDPLFTGTLVGVEPTLEADQRTVGVSCYATPGVLGDCAMPASSYPLEFNGLDLRAIAKALSAPFGVSVEFEGAPGAVFERVACEPGEEVMPFLAGLAKQRGFVISSTSAGALLFWKSTATGRPVARLAQGQPPVLSVSADFSPQDYYSHVTGLGPASVGGKGSQYTVRNERLSGVIRPHTFTLQDTEGADVPTATNAKAGRMFGAAASYAMPVATWRDPSGKLWAPNTTVKLLAPDAMIYREYEFLIRSVTLLSSGGSRTAVLNLVLPGVFSGVIPEVLPWD